MTGGVCESSVKNVICFVTLQHFTCKTMRSTVTSIVCQSRLSSVACICVDPHAVMLSPRGQSGLEAKILVSASMIWPWPQTFGLGLALILLSYYVIGHFLGKNRVKFVNSVNFSGNNLKSYVVNHYLVLFS